MSFELHTARPLPLRLAFRRETDQALTISATPYTTTDAGLAELLQEAFGFSLGVVEPEPPPAGETGTYGSGAYGDGTYGTLG